MTARPFDEDALDAVYSKALAEENRLLLVVV